MSENQREKVGKKQSNPRKIALIGMGATALAVINMMTNGPEAPSQGVVILQYAALAGGLLALVGGLVMMATAPKD
jgi:succinate-acetate transporter protein